MTRPQLGRGRRVLGFVTSLQKSHFRPEVFTNHTSKGNTVIPKKVIALSAIVGVAMSGFALAVPAHADPVAESYSIVGSDTLEDVVGSLIQGTSITGSPVRSLVNNAASGSFDATGTPYIVAKTSGKRFGRPNGSGDGRKALLASINNTNFQAAAQNYPNAVTGSTLAYPQVAAMTIPGEVDLVRSSSGGTADVAGAMVRIPFGRDAIGYVYDSGSAAGIENLTVAQLKQIFEGVTPVYATDGTTRITAVTPQTGSGTGSDWAGMIGANKTTIASSVVGGTVAYGQEHDASSLGINKIMPMSASRWIAMNTGGSYAKKTATTVMGTIEGVAAVTGTGASMVPNAAFYNSTVNAVNFGRDTYIIVEYARVTVGDAKYDANLADLVDPAKSTSLTNTSTSSAAKAGSVKLKYGFLAPSTTTQTRISG